MHFSEAFDIVCHQKLLLNLQHYAIRDKNLKWIENFLKNQTQPVVTEGAISSFVQVITNVPNVFVLGPMLFLVYINDLLLAVSSSICPFADDTYIYQVINSKEDFEEIPHNPRFSHQQIKGKLLDLIIKSTKCLEKIDHAKYLGVPIDKKIL